VAIRTVEGLNRLLYQPINEEDLDKKHYQIIGKTKANRKTINTTIFLKGKNEQKRLDK
jgi:hypothetical protein